MLKDRALVRMSCSMSDYLHKDLSRLTSGKAPTKGSNPVVNRNRRIKHDLTKSSK